MNQVRIEAQVVERAALRYTPAGWPALDLRLAHASQVEHAGQVRTISCEIHATVIGDLVKTAEALAVGSTAVFSGFLGKQRNGRGVMLHITGLESQPTSSY